MKKSLIFLLIFVLCIGVLVYGYVDTMTELKTHVNPAPQVGDEPGLAMAALEEAFGQDAYPDDFAGMYVDGASLVVMLTDSSDKTQAGYCALAGSYADCLVFREAKFSYAALQNALQAAEQDLKENGMLAPPAPGQTGPTNYVSVPDNCVVVQLRKNVNTPKMWLLERKYERQCGVPFDVSPQPDAYTITCRSIGLCKPE